MHIIIIAVLLISLLFKPTRRSVFALGALVGLNVLGVSIGANLLSACIVGFLGLPGIGTVALLNLIY